MLLSDHPLADSLWNTATGERLQSEAALADAIASVDFLLLGEKHDNPRHHELQAQMISLASGSGRQGHVVFEMLDPEHQPTLDQVNKRFSQTNKPSEVTSKALEDLSNELQWEQSGWPSWEIYREIFSTSLDASMSLHSGNPPRALLMSVGRGGPLEDAQRLNLRWDIEYSEQQRSSLLDELVDAHCGMMGRDSMGPLVTLQRLKDAFMARSMRQARSDNELSILIAGNGHTRKDRGVPMFLDKDASVLSIAFVEVQRNEISASNYTPFDPALYDYVWFTPRLDEIDPCDRFKEQLEQMRTKMGKDNKG